MKKTCILLLILIITGGLTHAQHLIEFTVDQPDFFSVEAGPDISSDGETPIYLSVEVNGGSGEYSYRWSPADKLDDAFISSPLVIDLTETTLFQVEVSDGYCEKESSMWVEFTTSVIEPWEGSRVVLFPNPTQDFFQLETDLKINSVQLIDISGKEMLSWQGSERNYIFRTGSLPRGVYVVQINFLTHNTQRILLCKL